MQKGTFTVLSLLLLLAVQSVDGQWVKQESGSFAWFQTIHFSDPSHGWIGGTRGTALLTVDGGKTWRPGPKFTSDTIKKIHFVDRLNGWALCERDIYSLGSNAPSYLMHTRDGGNTWRRVAFRDANRRRITKIVFSSEGHGIAVGEMGTLYGLEDDGSSWEKLASPTRYLIHDGAFGDQNKGAIVGARGTILYTENGGATWSRAVLSESTRAKLRSVYFVDSRLGWTAGVNGRIYRTVDGGKYWRRQRSGTAANLNDVYFVSHSRGWAVGEQGTVLRSTNGGSTWSRMGSKSRNHLEDITFNGNTGWIVGFGGTILRYDGATGTKSRPKLRR